MSIPSGPGGVFPLPNPWLQNNSWSPEVNELARLVQENQEKQQIAIGANASTVASIPLTGLYSGTWNDYTATAGFTPYYGKRAGLVYMGGAVTKNPTTTFPGSAQTILTLPVGFRPASTEQYAQVAVGGAGGTPTTGVVIIQITAAGVMSFISGVTGGGLTNNMAYIALSGITFGSAA